MAERVTKKLACGHSITLAGRIIMKDFRAWVKADKEGDFEASYGYLAQVIEAWDWDGLDPDAPASYDELELREYRQINEAVSEWVQAEAASKN